jgi:transcriptional regulator with XRE-family HTH domain
MPDLEQFGPRLRREREKRRISLEEIGAATNVAVDLWEGLERNDLSRWPSGVFARAFLRDYARIVGLDPDGVVDEFCRHFAIGDRRGSRILREHADLIGHTMQTAPGAEPLPAGRDRRRSTPVPGPSKPQVAYFSRAVAAALDLACVALLAALSTWIAAAGFWGAAGLVALIYYSAGTIFAGASPASHAIEILRQRASALLAGRRPVRA